MARDYMHKLSRAKNFLEAVPIHTEFMQSQLGFMGEQIKSLGEIYTKAAAEVLNAPLTTDAIRWGSRGLTDGRRGYRGKKFSWLRSSQHAGSRSNLIQVF